MKKTFYALAASLVFLSMFGCAQHSSAPAETQTVTLPGTGDSQDLLRELAKLYASQYPGRKVVVPDSISTTGGIEVVGKGKFHIGRVARLPNSEERARYGDFQYIEFARVPVVFVASTDVGVRDLSEQQICDIWSGRVTNWKEVGGNNLPIAVRDRPEHGSNKEAIRQHLACFTDLKVTSRAFEEPKNIDLVETMKHLSGAIGFMPLSEALFNDLKPVTLNGVAGDNTNYKLGIGLGFVYKQTLSPNIVAFIDYLKTDTARQVIRQTGHTLSWRQEFIGQTQSQIR